MVKSFKQILSAFKQYQQPNMIKKVLLLIFISIVHSLHSRHTLQTSNSQFPYLTLLAQKQDSFKASIQQIQNQITSINQIINNQNSGTLFKLNQLQKNINAQKATLLSTQNKLILPFNDRNIQCFTSKQDKLSQLTTQVDKLKQNLKDLKNTIQKCQKCPNFQENIGEIQRQQLYLDIVSSSLKDCTTTINLNQKVSGLVNIKDSYLKDNLKASNWYYGSITEDSYKKIVYQKASKFDLTSCPISTPFVTQSNDNCFDCTDGSAFNLGTRKCTKCPIGQFFDVKAIQCVPCQKDKIYSKKEQKCVDCPKGEIFNPKTGCQAPLCPKQSPIYNLIKRQCEACPIQTSFNKQKRQCIKIICPSSTPLLNKETSLCQKCPQNTIYNSASFICEDLQSAKYKCTIDESYDTLTKKCVLTRSLCKASDYYDQIIRRCVKLSSKCLPDELYDKNTRKCNKIPFTTSPYIFNLLYPNYDFREYIQSYLLSKKSNPNLRDCPMSEPYFSIKSWSCIKCSEQMPLFEIQTGVCVSCPNPTIYEPTQYKCLSTSKTVK